MDDVLDLRAVGHLFLDLVDHIEHARLSMEEQTVGIGDMVLNLLVDLGIVHHGGVGTAILHRIAACNDIGRHIVGEGRSCLDQREVASTGVGILDGTDEKMTPLPISQSPAIFVP